MLFASLGTNVSEICFKLQQLLYKKKKLKKASPNWQPFCLSLNELMHNKTQLSFIDYQTGSYYHIYFTKTIFDAALSCIQYILIFNAKIHDSIWNVTEICILVLPPSRATNNVFDMAVLYFNIFTNMASIIRTDTNFCHVTAKTSSKCRQIYESQYYKQTGDFI